MKSPLIASLSTERRYVTSLAENVCAVTDIGCTRKNNEDRFYISPDRRFFMVADGMGGEAAGEVASALAIQSISDSLANHFRESIDDSALPSMLIAALAFAQSVVLAAANSTPAWRNMGCAVLVACIHGDELFTCHVGDVRCYHLRDSTLVQISADHSLVAELIRAKHLTVEEGKQHPKKGVILQAIGNPTGIRPDVNRRSLKQRDRLLICSDGLWEALSAQEIQSVLSSEGSMRQLAIVLTDRANALGGQDNITVVTYEHL